MNLLVTINGCEIYGVRSGKLPTPQPDLDNATLEFLYDAEDQGQKIIDKIYYEGRGEACEIKVDLENGAMVWEYEAKITSYEISSRHEMRVIVGLELCGKFKYSRGHENPVIIKRDFSEIYKTIIEGDLYGI